MNIELLGERILVRLDEAPERIGSFFVPDTVRSSMNRTSTRGTVVAVGALYDEETWPAIGESIFIGKYAGTELEIDGEKLIVIVLSDVLGIDQRKESEASK